MTSIQDMIATATAVAEPNTTKIVATGLLSVLFFFYGNLYTDALVGVLMLMIIDTILGVSAAYHEGQVISSSRFCRSVLKGIVYFTAISAGYFADQTVPFDLIQATMIAFVGVTEFISILENIGRLGYETPKKLLNDLRHYQSTR